MNREEIVREQRVPMAADVGGCDCALNTNSVSVSNTIILCASYTRHVVP